MPIISSYPWDLDIFVAFNETHLHSIVQDHILRSIIITLDTHPKGQCHVNSNHLGYSSHHHVQKKKEPFEGLTTLAIRLLSK